MRIENRTLYLLLSLSSRRINNNLVSDMEVKKGDESTVKAQVSKYS